jgi:NAD(P)-dependent dehydrogenase (short-subunit alcohol dehydrogenase family)
MKRLQGKVALVTGAARGIGLAIARRFTDEGAFVIVNDLQQADADRAAIPLGGLGIAADVSSSAAVRTMFEEVAAKLGRLDVLVNNAGMAGSGIDPAFAVAQRERQVKQALELAAGGSIQTHLDAILEMSDEHWRSMLAVHLDGTFYCTREALRLMAPRMSGAIVNMSSVMGTAGGAGPAAYCAAKAGILGFTRSAAIELTTRNIRVNAIAPGWIETDMIAPLGEAVKAGIARNTPMRRLGEPDDIAWAAVYLASDEAKFVTGQVLSPSGGWYMSQ